MLQTDLNKLLAGDAAALEHANRLLEGKTAPERVHWALEHLPGPHVLSSSFGTQSPVMLHLLTRVVPDIPVVLIDTGYLFPETYQLIDELSDRFSLNLKVYRPELSAAWQEARFGRLWQQGLDGIDRYNRLNKVEPMQRALRELGAKTWFVGLRRQQADTRRELPVLRWQDQCLKVHPIVDWRSIDIHRYLRRHDLPEHPLKDHGYVSIGDTHTTMPLLVGMREEETRFFGLKRECGLHR